MVNYFNSIYIEPSIYSIDMVRLRLDFSGSERITNFGNFMSRVDLLYIEQYPQSFKAFSYRNLFKGLAITLGVKFFKKISSKS